MSTLADMLMRHEGLRLTVYDDANGRPIVPGSVVVGHPTVGWGRCLDKTGISTAEAEALFDRDLRLAIQQAEKYPWFFKLNETRQDVVVAMVFQLGARGFMEFKDTIQALAAGDFTRAATEMLRSEWGKKFPARARELSLMMQSGERNG